MDKKNTTQGDSFLEDLTGFRPKEFVIIISVAYMSILTLPMVIEIMKLPALLVVIGIMLIQYILLYYVAKNQGRSVLKTMTENGFIGWLMWLVLLCMLMLPVIHLISLTGIMTSGTF